MGAPGALMGEACEESGQGIKSKMGSSGRSELISAILGIHMTSSSRFGNQRDREEERRLGSNQAHFPDPPPSLQPLPVR